MSFVATDEVVARVGYAAICELEACAVGPTLCPTWYQLPPETKAELIAGVNFIFDHPSAPNSAQHDAWLARNAHRLHANDPRRGGYDKLSDLGKLKIALWRNICHAFVG